MKGISLNITAIVFSMSVGAVLTHIDLYNKYKEIKQFEQNIV